MAILDPKQDIFTDICVYVYRFIVQLFNDFLKWFSYVISYLNDLKNYTQLLHFLLINTYYFSFIPICKKKLLIKFWEIFVQFLT